MGLIDVDKLLFSLEEWELNETPISTYPKPKEFTADDMQRMIWRTIRDCESVVEEQPTVKAIPIEWIKKWINDRTKIWVNPKYADMEFTEVPFDYYENFTPYQAIAMLEDWEKENETNRS